MALNPKELNQRLARRQTELRKLMYPTHFPGAITLKPYLPTFLDAVGMVFAEAIAGEGKTPTIAGMRAYNLLIRPDVRKEIETEPHATPTRKLILAWCDSRSPTTGAFQAMYLMNQYKWPEARIYAGRVLKGNLISTYQIGSAAIILGEHGTRADAKYLQPYLKNATLVRGGSNISKEIQVRDFALAMMVLLTKHKLDEFDIKNQNTSNTSLNYLNFYFEDAEARTKALAKWNRLEPGLAVK